MSTCPKTLQNFEAERQILAENRVRGPEGRVSIKNWCIDILQVKDARQIPWYKHLF